MTALNIALRPTTEHLPSKQHDLTWFLESHRESMRNADPWKPKAYYDAGDSSLTLQMNGDALVLLADGRWYMSDTSGG